MGERYGMAVWMGLEKRLGRWRLAQRMEWSMAR